MAVGPSAGGDSGAGVPRARGRSVWPDLLTGSRLVLGPLFVWTFPSSPVLAFVVAVVAAVTDFVDGRLARRLGGDSPRGAVLDVAADAVFVLCGLWALAWSGVLSPALPLAAAVSLLALAVAWRRRSESTQRGWADRIGHRAGILNYGAVLVGSGVVAFNLPIPLERASWLVVAANLAPLLLRGVGRRK